MSLREQMIHGLRMAGWSRIEAENEADDHIARAASGMEAATADETVQLGSTEGDSPTGEAGDAQENIA